MITYSDILINTFSFKQTVPDQALFEKIWALDFPDTDTNIRKKIVGVHEEIRLQLVDFILKQDIEDFLLESVVNFSFDINKMTLGENVPMHNEISQKSPYEVILWLTKTDTYEGREFVMERGNVTTKIKPTNGLMCFLDTTSIDSYHGVTELLTDTEIISITGGLGRK